MANEIAEGIATTDQFEEVFSDPEIDAIAIATPAPTHYELAAAALLAGKDVFVEQLMALRLVGRSIGSPRDEAQSYADGRSFDGISSGHSKAQRAYRFRRVGGSALYHIAPHQFWDCAHRRKRVVEFGAA